MQPSGRGYDHGITTFSPDGRLFQVEYARESVKRGTTTAGLKFRDGVILVVDKRISSRLIIPESIEKVYKIDDHIGFATSGLVADARQLVDRARVQCQINRITYSDTIPVDALAKRICDFGLAHTAFVSFIANPLTDMRINGIGLRSTLLRRCTHRCSGQNKSPFAHS